MGSFWVSFLRSCLMSFLGPILEPFGGRFGANFVEKSTPKTRANFIHLGKPFRSHFWSISSTFWCHFGRISDAHTVFADIAKTIKKQRFFNGFAGSLMSEQVSKTTSWRSGAGTISTRPKWLPNCSNFAPKMAPKLVPKWCQKWS